MTDLQSFVQRRIAESRKNDMEQKEFVKKLEKPTMKDYIKHLAKSPQKTEKKNLLISGSHKLTYKSGHPLTKVFPKTKVRLI